MEKKFNIGENNEFLLTISDTDGEINFYKITHGYDNWTLEPETYYETMSDLGSVSAIRLFRWIANEVDQYIKRHDPPMMHYSPNTEGKAKVYTKIMTRLLKQSEYQIVEYDNAVYAYKYT